MTESISLKSFLRTGAFGSIKFGLERNEVAEILGEPDAVGGALRKYRESGVWKYGDVELFFDLQTGRLCLIVMNFWEPNVPRGGLAINLDPWIIIGGLQLSNLVTALDAEGIPYEEVPPINFGTRQVTVNSSITLIFNEHEEEFFPLTGLCKVYAGS